MAGRKRQASQFYFAYTCRYIDGVLSNINSDFESYLGQMYHPELEIKVKTESNTSASFLDLLQSMGRDGYLTTYLIRQGLLLLWMFNSEGVATFQ